MWLSRQICGRGFSLMFPEVTGRYPQGKTSPVWETKQTAWPRQAAFGHGGHVAAGGDFGMCAGVAVATGMTGWVTVSMSCWHRMISSFGALPHHAEIVGGAGGLQVDLVFKAAVVDPVESLFVFLGTEFHAVIQ